MSTFDDLLGAINQRQQGVDDPNQVQGIDVTAPGRQSAQLMQPTLQTAGDQALLQGPQSNVQMQDSPTFSPQQPVDQTPQPLGVNYNNSQQSQAVNAALRGEGPPPGGSANPGIYGLLPANLQHGTLRNVLGAIGDAFLVGGGGSATYRPRMEQQAIGQAMAGMDINDPNSVAAAVQRVAATGSPGSVEMADRLQQQAEQANLRKQYMQYNQDYRQQQTNNRNDQVFNRQSAMAQGAVAGAKDAADYASRYAQMDRRVKEIDPNQDAATAYGIPYPEEWKNTPGYGLTANQQTVSADKGASRAVSVQNNQATNAARVQAAGISGGAHIAASTGAASINAAKPTDATVIAGLIAKQNAGQPLTSAEQRFWDYHTQHPGRSSRSLPANVQVGGTPRTAPATQTGGTGRTPGAADAAYLRSHPNLRAQFDAHFGAGASTRILGH